MAKQPLVQAINPLRTIKKLPGPKASTGWNAPHPLTPLLKRGSRRGKR